MNTIVVPETKLEAHDPDKSDILFYTLQEVTPVSVPRLRTSPTPSLRPRPRPGSSQGLRLSPIPLPPPQGASNFFSLVGTNLPALRLDRSLDFYQCQNMTFQLLVRVSRPGHSSPHLSRPQPGAPGPHPAGFGCCRTHRSRTQHPATRPRPP